MSVVPDEKAAVASAGVRAEALHFALRNGKLLAGLAVLLALLLLGLFGPLVSAGDPNAYVGPQFAPPSGDHWFGTTLFGQDIFTQFVHGLRATFLVGLLGGGIAAVIGMAIGFTAGYRGGVVDEVLNMLTNIVLVLPALAVLLVINAYLGIRSIPVQAVFIGLTSWPWVARAIRAQTFSLRTRDFVDLARLSGVRPWKIMTTEIAPNMSSYLFMAFILLFGGSVLIGASLDFVGLGPTDSISLGLMLNNAARYNALHLGMWWWFIPPGLGITAVVGSLYVMNVGLDEVFNPKLREM
ncbi:ABC transporter permease [Nonomuraea africana]|uniref:Peptide/nickel transport system permease protein n=1 Tax=Nonomuraea africana TaxID=46171 RepID=A0ABR9KGB6_9ACTN|nr:ABC transporter permease [Nonomuraea africana]MBE1561069.1 peptide/nickel transport system permease protein [Nonomuraea africana]